MSTPSKLSEERLRDIRLAVADFQSGGLCELRSKIEDDRTDLMQHVAAQSARIKELEAALEPFATEFNTYLRGNVGPHQHYAPEQIEFFRRAAAALKGEG